MEWMAAWTLAKNLVKEHLPPPWGFKFDRAVRRAGCCKHRKKLITLSEYFALNNSVEEVIDVVKHEIAHALAGPKHGHDAVWKAICIKIGAKPERCYDAKVVKMPTGKYVAICPKCSKEYHFHRRPTKTGYMCGKCLKNGPLVFKRVG